MVYRPTKEIFKAGQRLSAEDLQAVVDSIFRRITGGKGILVKQFSEQLIIELASRGGKWNEAGSGSGIRLLTYRSSSGDSMICWDANSQNITVAKPYLLRRTPFDGLTRSGISYAYSSDIARTATLDATTESQVIVPSFVTGDLLFVADEISGGTGVDGVSLIDLNVDGRAWAQVV